MKNLQRLKKYGPTLQRKALTFCGVTGAVLVSASASAALPTEAEDAFTSIQTDALSMISAGWVPLVAITTGLILMRLFKKVISRAFS